MQGERPKRSRFTTYPIGYFHVDITEVHTEEGRLQLFVAIDRTSKFAFAQLHERATRRVAANFLHALVQAVPYRIHTVLSDNGTQFVETATLSAAEAARPADHEPVLWLIRDQRAATVVLHDHHWLRILDVKAVLQARRYNAPGSLSITVDDRLGFAAGTYLLEVAADGSSRVTRTDAPADLRLDVATLSALYLGAWRTSALAHAGRVTELTEGAVRRFDEAFRADEAPTLSFWY